MRVGAQWTGTADGGLVLDIGPVLHPDDAVANKKCALFGRAAEPYDLTADKVTELRERLVAWADQITGR